MCVCLLVCLQERESGPPLPIGRRFAFLASYWNNCGQGLHRIGILSLQSRTSIGQLEIHIVIELKVYRLRDFLTNDVPGMSSEDKRERLNPSKNSRKSTQHICECTLSYSIFDRQPTPVVHSSCIKSTHLHKKSFYLET